VFCDQGGSAVLSCCDLFGNAGGDWTGCSATQVGINGNFSADPMFCGAQDEDFSLQSGSPCLDVGGCGLIVGAFGGKGARTGNLGWAGDWIARKWVTLQW
jgi:hypothetical protein